MVMQEEHKSQIYNLVIAWKQPKNFAIVGFQAHLLGDWEMVFIILVSATMANKAF